MPTISQSFSVPRKTTSLITEFSPGTSPPPVRMPMRLRAMLYFIERGRATERILLHLKLAPLFPGLIADLVVHRHHERVGRRDDVLGQAKAQLSGHHDLRVERLVRFGRGFGLRE